MGIVSSSIEQEDRGNEGHKTDISTRKSWSEEEAHKQYRDYIPDNSWRPVANGCHSHSLMDGMYQIRDLHEVLLTETRPLVGLERVDIKLPSVDAISVCSTIV